MSDDLFPAIALAMIDYRELGFVDDPRDSGGATKYGITTKTAAAWGYECNIRNLNKPTAIQIYRELYWQPLSCHRIMEHSEKIAIELFDTAVNLGVSKASTFLQRSLNILNSNELLFNDLSVDSIIGIKTLSALQSYLNARGNAGVEVLFKVLNSLQGTHYIELAERRPKDERFTFGWFAHRIGF